MIDSIDLVSLETATRDLIGEDTARLWSSAQVVRAINAEVSRLARKVIDLDMGYFETSASYTPAATLTLPVNCYVVRNIEAYANGSWYGVRWIDDHNRGQYQVYGGDTTGFPLGVRFVENGLAFEGGIGGISSIRVQYARAPSALRSLSVSSATDTTATFSEGSPYDDVYIGDRVVATSGTGIGQVRVVTDYDAATFTITVATWATNPDTTTILSWALPDPLHKWGDVVSLGAAIRLLGRRRDTEAQSALMSQYVEDLADMMGSLGQRQTDQPQRVNYIPDGLE